jgi:hypothetical protein
MYDYMTLSWLMTLGCSTTEHDGGVTHVHLSRSTDLGTRNTPSPHYRSHQSFT